MIMFGSLKNIQTKLIKNAVSRLSIKLRIYLEITW